MARDSIEVIRLKAALPLIQQLQHPATFRSAAEEAPFLLRSLGLGAGLSMLAAKEGERAELARMIAAWLLRDCPHSPWRRQHNTADVRTTLAAIAVSSRDDYRAAQIEAIGFASSVKRLAQALCEKKAG